jgi:hypothetical protein
VADEPGRVGDQPRVSKLESVEVLLRRGRLGGNGAERSLLGIAVGRKNRIFFGIENGGWTAAVLTSFITSCRRLNIDPLAYFRDRLGVWRLQHLK